MSLQVLQYSLAVHRLSVSRGQSGVHEGIRSKKCTTTTEINLACCVSFAETSSKSETDVSFRREFHLGRRGKVARDRVDFFSFFFRREGRREKRDRLFLSYIIERDYFEMTSCGFFPNTSAIREARAGIYKFSRELY